jgi:DNA topoisomerase-2
MSKNINIAKKYQKLSPVEHVLKRPGMYIGGIETIEDSLWILDQSKDPNKIVEKIVSYSPGLYKIFDEIIVNAYDQSIVDPTLNLIKVNINVDKDNNEITVYNNGKGIDVVMHPKEKVYVPELIFGHLRTSTSFDEEKVRITGGIHGLGAKLTAIFSTYFKVEVGDPVHKKKFSQYYKNNLSFKSKPVISNYDKKDGYVKITFKPDLKYFGLAGVGISEDLANLMRRRVYDLAALTKGMTRKEVKVYLDDKRLPINNFRDYVSMFTDKEQLIERCEDLDDSGGHKDRWSIVITPSNGQHKQISFVNGIYTAHGGRHVDYIMNKLIKQIKDYIQVKYKTTKVNTQFIKDHMWIFISSVIENPTFSSQTKEELVTPVNKFGSTCDISKDFVKRFFKKLKFDEVVREYVKFTERVALVKLDTKKKKKIKGIPKLYDANFAGTKKASLCTLILTEGDSAKAMAISGLGALGPKGNNTYGIFPLKGKLLNVREAPHKKIIGNEEFKNLKQIIGLEINKVYNETNIGGLRYGSVVLMMDADVDGSHIKGLFINMIHYYWPSLLKIRGFIKVFITPIVKVSYKDVIKSFYTQTEYDNWKKKTRDSDKYTIKYYKGLGTNTASEAKEYFSNLDHHLIDFEWIESSDTAIQLAFAKEKADARKEWLKDYDKDDILDFSARQFNYKDFINKELIHFSNYDNIRSIPNLIDGLKPSQRKVLYGCFKRNLNQDVKVAQLTGYISEHTSYHHGEVSLANTIIAMAQNFVGSNNLNMLVPKGQYGTRLIGGKDHSSPRYIFTQLEEICRLIYHKDDDPLLNYLNDDGFPIEPAYYIPVIPMILINGSEGIGTGYSTYIPKFNPSDIIEYLQARLKGEKATTTSIKPWYKGFKGVISKKEQNIYITKGLYEISKADLKITELPITSWTENYKIFLETVIAEQKHIRSVTNNSTESTIDFTVKFSDEATLNSMLKKSKSKMVNELEQNFGLVRMINMNNMHMYNSEGKIKRYNNVNKILDEFYTIRLDFYDKRKKYILKKLEKEISILSSKMKFISLVVDKKINLFNKKKDDIIKILDKQKLIKLEGEPPYDYLIRMSFYSLTKEKISELDKQLKNKRSEYNNLKKKKIEEIWIGDLEAIKKML